MGIGMVFYIGGFAGGLVGTVTSQMSESGAAEQIENQIAGFDVTGGVNAVMSIPQAMATLGLTLSVSEYLLFGLQIILSLAIGLAASLILGAMATDTKSLGSLMMPVVMITMLPFFITMFVNVNEMTFVFKAIMYIIPFTHSYMAVPNLISGNNLLFWCGIIYQLLFLAGTLYAAIRMFMSDKLFTVNFGDTSNQTKRKSLFGMKK
jgi:ABC-2 type transport system permease protein